MRNRPGPRSAPKLRFLLAGVLVGAVLGACSNSQRPAPAQSAESSTPSHANFTTSDPTVAWSERICGALLPVVGAGSPPRLDTHDLEGSRKRFHTYLRDHVDALDAALADISAAGPAPVIKGPQVNQLLVTTLSKLRDAFAAGSAELDVVPQNERDYTLVYTLAGISSLLVPTEGRTLLDLVRPVSLESAIRQASSCQAVDASAGTPGVTAMPTPMR